MRLFHCLLGFRCVGWPSFKSINRTLKTLSKFYIIIISNNKALPPVHVLLHSWAWPMQNRVGVTSFDASIKKTFHTQRSYSSVLPFVRLVFSHPRNVTSSLQTQLFDYAVTTNTTLNTPLRIGCVSHSNAYILLLFSSHQTNTRLCTPFRQITLLLLLLLRQQLPLGLLLAPLVLQSRFHRIVASPSAPHCQLLFLCLLNRGRS